MKKIKLTKGDVYDLSTVLAIIIKEESKSLKFDEIIKLQKIINLSIDGVRDFSDEMAKLNEERKVHVDNANAKIAEFKEELQNKVLEKGESTEEQNEQIANYVNMVVEETNKKIDVEVSPKELELRKGMGAEEIEFELDEESHKILVDKFEEHAKEKYINKNKMVEVYEVITSA